MKSAYCKCRCWEYFDKFYCISVAEREDRRQSAKRQFSRVGLADRVEFVIVEKHPEDCEQGIYESHLACIRKGIEAGIRRMVIFEDDIVFDRFSPRRLDRCIHFLKNLPDWNILFLGCLVSRSYRTDNPAVRKIKYRSLSHGYALNRSFAEKLIERPWHRVPYDGMLREFGNDYYALYPSVAFQSNSRSDNIRLRDLERFRRMCGGLQLIQKTNERYHSHRHGIILLHLLVALLAAAWLF